MNNTNFNYNKEKFSILEGIKDLKLNKKWLIYNDFNIYVNSKYYENKKEKNFQKVLIRWRKIMKIK